MDALRPKLVRRLRSMMATVEQSTGSISGSLSAMSAGRIADAVLSVTRQHDEEYAQSLELAAAFRRLPVEISIGDTTAEGQLTEESVAMLGAAAERDFAARQREADPWAAPWKGDREPDGDVVDAHICCEHVMDDRELSAMAEVIRQMGRTEIDPYAVVRALYPLNGHELHRVLRWFLARYPGVTDPVPF